MKTKEEVLIKLGEQSKKVNVELANIADILSVDIGRGDSKIVEGRKKISEIVSSYKESIVIYNEVVQTGNKYLEMAKALGDNTMISRLNKNIKDASSMVKTANSVISKLQSL